MNFVDPSGKDPVNFTILSFPMAFDPEFISPHRSLQLVISDVVTYEQYGIEGLGTGDYTTLAPSLAAGAHVAGTLFLTGKDFTSFFPPGENQFEDNSHSGRQKNFLEPDPNAQGSHSTFRRNEQGQVTTHEEWKQNPHNPSGFDSVKRTDTQYYSREHSHYNKQTGQDVSIPHTQGKNIPGGIRPANPDELPQ